jgi:septum site-determining protein MinD
MRKIITIHSFRRGVGKSSLASNLAASFTLQGKRVALIDADFQQSSAHLFFGMSDGDALITLNDYLSGRWSILDAVQDVTERLNAPQAHRGKLFLLSPSTKQSDIMRMLRSGIDGDRFTEGLTSLYDELNLDVLIIDSAPGVNEDTLTSVAMASTLLLVMHPENQSFQGTAVIVEVAKALSVPKIQIILNDIPASLNVEEAETQIEQAYQCGSGLVLPHSDELMALASRTLFVVKYPEHALTEKIYRLGNSL